VNTPYVFIVAQNCKIVNSVCGKSGVWQENWHYSTILSKDTSASLMKRERNPVIK